MALEIEKTTKELEVLACDNCDVILPDILPKWLWNGDRNTFINGVRISNRNKS